MALAAYSIFSAGGTQTITHDYVRYMKSNSILIGAEFEKVVIILTVTVVIALGITRARKLLVSSVAEETAVRDLSRFFFPRNRTANNCVRTGIKCRKWPDQRCCHFNG